VFIVIAAGFFLHKLVPTETKSLSNMILNIFTPCLVFTSIVSSSFESKEWWQICLTAVTSILILVILSWIIAKALHLSKELAATFVLTTSFVNAGNYGLPLTLFAFGESGLALAVIFYVISNILTLTLGVFVASQGRYGLKQSIRNIVRLPIIYATLAAVAVRVSGSSVPRPVFQGLGLMSQAAVPCMLIVLGIELAHSDFRQSSVEEWKFLSLTSVIKLLLPILVVALFSQWIGLVGLARSVALVQASMPTAVFVVIISLKYGGNSRFATNAVVISTLASIVTLTLLLSILR
jgi:hypothetical protein